MRKSIFTLLLLFPVIAFAQGDLDDLMKESIADGEKLIGGYISPLMKSVTLGLNQGWYHSAKTHKKYGVDFTITATALSIPKHDLFYDVSKLELENVELDPSSPDYPRAPTVFGPDRAPSYRPIGSTDPEEVYSGPGGIDLEGNLGKNWMPVPVVALGFGLPKNIDIRVRFIPSIALGDEGSVKMFGIGVMHDVKQYIPSMETSRIDLSAFVGYTRLALDYTYTDAQINAEQPKGEMRMNATTIQGVVSEKFSVLTLYVGLGYNIAKSSLAVKGKWDVNEDDTFSEQEIDPINLTFDASGPCAKAGLRLKFSVITFHADYTFQKYNALTAGFGIYVR